MKNFEKVLLAVLFIAAAVAVIVVVSHDAKAKTGAFAESKDVYPVTSALLTSKKVDFRGDIIDRDKVTDRETEVPETAQNESETEPLQETVEETAPEEPHVLETEAPADTNDGVYRGEIYQVCGVELDREIGDFLAAELRAHDIEWWLPIALAQIFQESRMDPLARNKNNLDMGILQYRVTYWDWSRGDIFDWRAQIRLYCEQTARRLASGCSIWETVSRHNTSDYGAYNQEYVDQVFQWLAPEC